MNTIKLHALLAFGLTTALSLNTAYAQSEHDGHHPANAPAEQAAPQASQPKAQGGMQGMDHDQMMQMHDQHMRNGQMMDHDGAMPKDMPKPAEKGNQHAH
ncbi:hypothetical protein [Stutzerimonas balearica]|uniref:hypothetical protein n=1 Tax=Stutzerimonas balearica TaxID=74829 RepID=UPI0028A6D2B3|nr:hypothetical protein [Stutzerimonas balearica]